ncbi:MAG: hypothetical protein ACLU4N_09490 [Butyricimonas faecihominis]
MEPEIEGAVYETRGRGGETIVAVGQVIPPDAIELKKQLKFPWRSWLRNRTRF